MKRLTIALAIVLLAGTANAQDPFRRNSNPQNEPISAQAARAGETGMVGSKIFDALAKPFKDLADFIGADVTEAIRLSTAVSTLQDTNGQVCWQGFQDFASIVKEHPVPATFRLASDVQALRLMVMTTNKLCGNVHCRTVFGDMANLANAASPVPLPASLDPLSLVCSKVAQLAPQLPVVATAAAPLATPTPAPAK